MKPIKAFLIAALILTSFAGMAQIQDINIGTTPNDRTGDPIRTAFNKANLNFDYLDAKATASGTDTYTATINPVITSYVTNQRYFITFTNANTGPATLNLNGLGAKSIRKFGNAVLSSGDISAGQGLFLFYDGANLQILGDGGDGLKVFLVAASDETTALSTGTAKVTFRMPYAMTVTEVRASLTTAQTSGSLLTVDINESGTSILSTKLTFDNTEKTTTTAATPSVISDASLANDAEITVDIPLLGNGTAAGLKITLIGN